MSLIELRGLTTALGDQEVLTGLDLDIRRGEVLFLIGTSGVGKSVTIKHIVGLMAADRGEVWFDGVRIDQLSEKKFYPIRKRIAMVFQHATLFDAMTLQENVALPLVEHRRMAIAAALGEAGRRLEQVHIERFAARYPGDVSPGVRKRAAIARALTLEPEAVLFDEPTTGLDPVAARRIDRLIRELADLCGVTCVVVSHDLVSMFAVADRIALLYQGRIHACGTADEFRNSPDPIVQQFISGRSEGPMQTPGF